MICKKAMTILAKRIREARLLSGISQQNLAIKIGVDPSVASTRMNRYEQGSRTPGPVIVELIARELKLPAAYFYAETDDEAKLLRWFSQLGMKEQAKVMQKIEAGAGKKRR